MLATEGVMFNPHWLPADLTTMGTLREQVNHWAGGTASSLIRNIPHADRHAAEATKLLWLPNRRAGEPPIPAEAGRKRWKICCFGRLRVCRAAGIQVDWGTAGGATLKTRTLFAYLLQQGGKGARVDELADLLSPAATSADLAWNRLYHTIGCLRMALAGADKTRGAAYVLRDGSNFALVPPDRSWPSPQVLRHIFRRGQLMQFWRR